MRTTHLPMEKGPHMYFALVKKHISTLIPLALLNLVLLVAVASHAQEPPPTDIERRLKELEEEVDRLKKAQRQTEIPVEKQKSAVTVQDDFSLATADGRFKLGLRGYLQGDGRFFINDNTNLNGNQFLLRRVRPILEGTVFRYFDFKLMPDFGQGKTVLFDAYADANYFREARLRIGKFKAPIGLERLQSARNLFFVERGLPNDLVPTRDIGVQLFGDVLGGTFSYALGIFNGAPDRENPDGDTNDDKDFDGRIFAHPFKRTSSAPLKGLAFGVAGSYGRERGNSSSSDLPKYLSTGQATFFSYVSSSDPAKNALAFGVHSRISPQGYYFWGPAGVMVNYVASNQGALLGNKRSRFHNAAWEVVGIFAVTGEPESYDSIVPAQNFEPWENRWGGVELVARYGVLDIDSDAFAQGFADPTKSARQAKEWVIGVNWHLNRSVKLVLDYANTDFKGGSTSGDRRSERAILSRVQLAFPS